MHYLILFFTFAGLVLPTTKTFMQETLSNSEIIRFLKEKFQGAGYIDGLKIKYRSLICPFIDLIEKVKPGEHVGDVGCGSGQYLLLLTHFTEASYLYGIEITPRLVENANKLFSNQPAGSYSFNTYDGENFPEKLKEMDVIFLIDVLHHVPPKIQEDFLKNLIKSMKPGARLILKDINASSPLVLFNKLHDLVFAREIGNEMKMNTAINILQENGLRIIEQTKRRMYVYPHYTIVAKK